MPPSEQPSREQDWIAGLHAGDQATFEAIFRAYYPRLVILVQVYVRSKETAEDLVQQLFLALWRRHRTLEITDSLNAYLFRAARNTAFNHLRHARVERLGRDRIAAAPLRLVAPADEMVGEHDLARAIDQAVEELPERCRLVFTLSRREGLSQREIAEALGISLKTVETQIHRAFEALRHKLAPFLAFALTFLR